MNRPLLCISSPALVVGRRMQVWKTSTALLGTITAVMLFWMANAPAAIVTNYTITVTTNTVIPSFGTIDPVSATLIDRFNFEENLRGFMFADQEQNWGPTLFYSTRWSGSAAEQFDTISTIPPFVGAVTDRFGLSSTNYDALTLSAPDVGYGAVNFYYVRHDNNGVSTFGVIKAAGASSSADLWVIPKSGYNALAFVEANLGYGANLFYFLRQDADGLSTFGTINPTPGGIATDQYAVGNNFDSLVFVPGAVSSWGAGIFAYLRHDNTGSIIGTIDPVTHVVTDRVSLGTNFLDALTFTATDVGYGLNLFYYLRPARTSQMTNTVAILTANDLSSSANPSPTGSPVTFTTTWMEITPGSGTPTGTVQFHADGAVLGSPAILSSGVASLTTSSLTHGTHTITAEYTGDSNFSRHTNSLSQDVNSQPRVGGYTLQRHKDYGVKVRPSTLLANGTDGDGDSLTLISVDSMSTAGGELVKINNWIHYTPPAGFTNADSCSYVISDGRLQATGSLSVIIRADLGPSQNVTAVEDVGNGSFRVTFAGIPGRNYTVQSATNLTTLDWRVVGIRTADLFGRFESIDTPAPGPPCYYRATYP